MSYYAVILSDEFLISSYLDKCPNEHITPYGKSLYNEILKKILDLP